MLLITVVHVFVTSPIDYCNSLLCGMTDSNNSRLQRIQNGVAHMVTNNEKYSHIKISLQKLHWLPVKQFSYHVPLDSWYWQNWHNVTNNYFDLRVQLTIILSFKCLLFGRFKLTVYTNNQAVSKGTFLPSLHTHTHTRACAHVCVCACACLCVSI